MVLSDEILRDDGYPWLGGLLLRKGLITQQQLDEALELQKENGKYLGETLAEGGSVSMTDVYEALAEQLGLPFVSLESFGEADVSVLQMVPEHFATRFKMLPISLAENTLKIAVTDQFDVTALDSIASKTGCMVECVLAERNELEESIKREYSRLSGIEDELQDLLLDESETDDELATPVEDLESGALDAPIVRFVNLLIHQAIEKKASDLHIEPQKGKIDVRARIDGVLHALTPPTRAMFPAVLSRIKILSGLDISERRLPQDGKCSVENKDIDIRVSTLPTIYGEKVVMRLLDKRNLMLGLPELGFEPEQQEAFERALRAPQGIILNTGPTGSGKTTTLYSGLNFVRSVAKNIVTVEDPVEYELPGINQVQVKSMIGFTFASALRSILRQDPDIVMVGEIRDFETAEIAVRAALTGHLVLSTLHTNNAVATINRLKDMGVQPYMLASCVDIIMAQRLVRRICSRCKKPDDVPPAVRRQLGIGDDVQLYKGSGCKRCMNTGYSGRVGIYELLKVTKPIAEAIGSDASESELVKLAKQEGMITLHDCGIRKIRQGLTTPEEIMVYAERE